MSTRPVRVCSELSYEILWTLVVPKAAKLKESKLEVKDFENTKFKPKEIYLINLGLKMPVQKIFFRSNILTSHSFAAP